jgi:hypothetical protein
MTWPSTHAPGTMGFMIDRIDDELKRSGTINDRIQVAIVDAVNIYKRERFRFNETFTSTFLTTGGQQNYNIFTDVNFPTVVSPLQIYKIDWLTITIPPAVFDMPRMQPEEILILTQTGTQMGQPYTWAYSNETIMLYPIPTTGTPGSGPVSSLGILIPGSGYTPSGTFAAIPATGGHGTGLTLNVTTNSFGQVQSTTVANPGVGYQVGDIIGIILGLGTGFQETVMAINATGQGPFLMTIGGHAELQSPAGNLVSGQATTGFDVAGNRWFTDGEKLIRSRAKYELAINVLRDPMLAIAMSPFPPERNGGVTGAAYDAYEMLAAENARMQQRGLIKAMYF